MNALNSDLKLSKKGSNNVQNISFKRTMDSGMKSLEILVTKYLHFFFEDLVF